MADAVIFAGPSLSSADLQAGWARRPPAGRGDVLRALLVERPRVIGLIDGWIDDRPAVTHKEIIHALAEGVAVLGAAGMGAIRAVELGTFGMRGVGEVYRSYADGFLDGDDEVAVATRDGIAVSLALVDLRATLERAIDADAVAPEAARGLLAAARSLHYAVRTVPTILERAQREGLATDAIEAIAQWLATGFRSVKAEDAVGLLGAVGEALVGPPPRHSGVRPTESAAWHALRAEVVAEFRCDADAGTSGP